MDKEYLTIEEWKERHATPGAVFEGTKALKGWKTGKQVTDKEYTEACSLFENAPADGQDKEAEG